jgi:hypothetical protein
MQVDAVHDSCFLMPVGLLRDTPPTHTAIHMPTSLTWGRNTTAAGGGSDHGRDAGPGARVGEGC